MRVNIQVGGRFHSLTLADALARLGSDTVIYTSAPPKNFRSGGRQHVTSFVPLPVGIVKRLTGWQSDLLDPLDSAVFDRVAAAKMRECDILHGWAGYALYSGTKAKASGAAFLLERSCPHLEFQERLLEQEAEALGIRYRKKPSFWMDRSRAEYELADFIVVPSEYTRRSFIERGFPVAKIAKAPLDLPVLYSGCAVQRPPSGEFVVGTLGGNVLRKGFLYLLQAWKQLRLPNSRLLIKAPEAELRRSPVLAEYLASCPNIEIQGYFEEISSFYRQCDVFCLASIDDGFGLVMVEALANGLPVIVSQNVGASEVLPETDAGFVVPIRDADAIAEKLYQLYADRALRAHMGERALALTERLASSEGQYFKSIQRLYEDARRLSTAPPKVSRDVRELERTETPDAPAKLQATS